MMELHGKAGKMKCRKRILVKTYFVVVGQNQLLMFKRFLNTRNLVEDIKCKMRKQKTP